MTRGANQQKEKQVKAYLLCWEASIFTADHYYRHNCQGDDAEDRNYHNDDIQDNNNIVLMIMSRKNLCGLHKTSQL